MLLKKLGTQNSYTTTQFLRKACEQKEANTTEEVFGRDQSEAIPILGSRATKVPTTIWLEGTLSTNRVVETSMFFE